LRISSCCRGSARRWQRKISKVSSTFIFYSKSSGILTFANFFLPAAAAALSAEKNVFWKINCCVYLLAQRPFHREGAGACRALQYIYMYIYIYMDTKIVCGKIITLCVLLAQRRLHQGGADEWRALQKTNYTWIQKMCVKKQSALCTLLARRPFHREGAGEWSALQKINNCGHKNCVWKNKVLCVFCCHDASLVNLVSNHELLESS